MIWIDRGALAIIYELIALEDGRARPTPAVMKHTFFMLSYLHLYGKYTLMTQWCT